MNPDVVYVTAEFLKHSKDFFHYHGYSEVLMPHLTRITGACENIDTLFEVNFFNTKAYLAQTSQLYLETLVPKYKKVWCVGPSFRAENVIDDRHLCEFYLMELELEGNFEQLLSVITNLFSYVFSGLGLEFKPERMTYTKAIQILQEDDFQVKWGDDIKSDMEKHLAKDNPLFITHYPKEIKFFNMRENDEDSTIVNSADLILPGAGECVGAAEREYTYDKLKERLIGSAMFKRLIEKGNSINDFGWYLDFYKNPSMLHAGCGIGVNRVLQYIMNLENIKDTSVYPITPVSIF